MSRGRHWHAKDRKEDVAQDIREFVQRDDPKAEMLSLVNMTMVDLTALMLAIRSIEQVKQ
jgi:hypothetical protein